MDGRVFVDRIQHEHGPLDDTVAQIAVVEVYPVMGVVHVGKGGIGLQRVGISTFLLEPGIFVWPEQLNRVALTQIERVACDVLEGRTDDDVMEIAVVAVPYNGIGRVLDACPFAFPCVFELASVTVLEPRIDRVAEHNRILLDLLLADERGVVLLQVRNDTQGQVDGRIATINGRVAVVYEMTLVPDRIRSDAA